MDLSENGEGSGHTRSKPQAQDVDINPPDPEQQIPRNEPAKPFPESIRAHINSTSRDQALETTTAFLGGHQSRTNTPRVLNSNAINQNSRQRGGPVAFPCEHTWFYMTKQVHFIENIRFTQSNINSMKMFHESEKQFPLNIHRTQKNKQISFMNTHSPVPDHLFSVQRIGSKRDSYFLFDVGGSGNKNTSGKRRPCSEREGTQKHVNERTN